MDQRLSRLGVKIFADGADFDGVLAMYKNPLIKGFTTNPTLMRKAGVSDYEGFARRLLAAVPDRPISFEVFADEPLDMVRQARVYRYGRNFTLGRGHCDQCHRRVYTASGSAHRRVARPGNAGHRLGLRRPGCRQRC